jgi:hypothetical protein
MTIEREIPRKEKAPRARLKDKETDKSQDWKN